jgi:hypothetical protein
MKYTFNREELENLKTKILSDVADFLVELVKQQEKKPLDMYDHMSIRNKTIYINVEDFKNDVDNLRNKLTETIKNL